MKIVLTQLEEKKHSELIAIAQIIATPPERKHIKIIATPKLGKKHSGLIAIAQILATPPERKHIIKTVPPKLEIKHSGLIAIALPVEALYQQSSRVTPNPQLRARKRVCNSRVLMTPRMVGTIPWVKSTTSW